MAAPKNFIFGGTFQESQRGYILIIFITNDNHLPYLEVAQLQTMGQKLPITTPIQKCRYAINCTEKVPRVF